MGKQVADVSLQFDTARHRDVPVPEAGTPTVENLTGRRVRRAPRRATTRPVPGARPEPRLPPVRAGHPGGGRDAGRPGEPGRGHAVGPDVLGQGLVRAIWTNDEALSTRINGSVAHYTGQAELAQVIQEGLEARKQGDEDTATAGFGRAVALAEQSGNEGTASTPRWWNVVDAASGTVQLKKVPTMPTRWRWTPGRLPRQYGRRNKVRRHAYLFLAATTLPAQISATCAGCGWMGPRRANPRAPRRPTRRPRRARSRPPCPQCGAARTGGSVRSAGSTSPGGQGASLPPHLAPPGLGLVPVTVAGAGAAQGPDLDADAVRAQA